MDPGVYSRLTRIEPPMQLVLPQEHTDGELAELHLGIDRLREEIARLCKSLPGADGTPGAGTWLWPDFAKDEVILSPNLARILGVDPLQRRATLAEASATVHPEDAPGVRAIVRHRSDSSGDFSFAYRIRRDGGFVWVRTYGEVTLRPAAGPPSSARGTTVCVGADADLLRRLHRTQPDLARVMVKGGVRLWDWPIVGSSPLEITGYDHRYVGRVIDARLGMRVWDPLVHPEDVPACDEALACLLGETHDCSTELRLRLDGEAYRWFLFRGICEHLPGGHRRATGTLVDIHDRKSAERANRADADRLAMIMEASRAGTWEWPDTRRPKLLVDASLIALLGYTPEDFEPNVDWCAQLIHADDRARCAQAMAAALRDGLPYFECDFRVRFATRGYRQVRATGKAMRCEGGRVRVLCSVIDIHDRYVAEAALAESNAQLASFSYTVAHDLAAPLRQIETFADIIAEESDGSLDARARHYLGIIRKAAANAFAMTHDLLAYAKTGTAVLRPRAIDLDELLAEVCATAAAAPEAAHVRFDVAPLPSVEADETQLRMLFQNLVGNAVKFSASREAPVVHVYAVDGDPRECTVVIEDNGVGFEPHLAARIFEPFERGHDGDDFDGSGIGLAHVLRIVERHRGRITADGTPGRGAIFAVTLPRVMA